MTTTAIKLQLRINIYQDTDTESPLENADDFQFTTFGMNSRYDGPMPDESEVEDSETHPSWWVSCYRHGGEHWFLRGGDGPNCQWDTRQRAGLLRFTGKREDYGDLNKVAKSIISEFNDWANGRCYWYQLAQEQETRGACPTCHTGTDVPQRNFISPEDYGSGDIIGDEWLVKSILDDIIGLQTKTGVTPDRYAIQLGGESWLSCLQDDIKQKVQALGYDVVD
jgi:hypothetical protein